MKFSLVSTALVFGATVAVGCSDKNTQPPASDAGTGDDGGTVFVPPVDPGAGGVLITISGEAEAAKGYPWAAGALSADNAFVDGWELSYEHLITTVGNIRLNADPDKDGANPQNTGPIVAQVAGAFAVDLTLGGSLPGKSGEPDDKAVALAAISKTQANLDPAARYAFSYDTLVASANAKQVNLNAAGKLLYADAVAKGYSMVVQGTATYKGPAPTAGSVFAKMPSKVRFTFGLKNPSTYANCANDDLAEVGGEYPRGLQAKANSSIVAQISWHTDHMFWSKLNVEGTPLHFDPVAALASSYGTPGSEGSVSADELATADVTAFKTKASEVLPWRSLVTDYAAPAGQVRFDVNGTSLTPVNNYRGFLAYSAASGGHLNKSGECAIKYNFTP